MEHKHLGPLTDMSDIGLINRERSCGHPGVKASQSFTFSHFHLSNSPSLPLSLFVYPSISLPLSLCILSYTVSLPTVLLIPLSVQTTLSNSRLSVGRAIGRSVSHLCATWWTGPVAESSDSLTPGRSRGQNVPEGGFNVSLSGSCCALTEL